SPAVAEDFGDIGGRGVGGGETLIFGVVGHVRGDAVADRPRLDDYVGGGGIGVGGGGVVGRGEDSLVEGPAGLAAVDIEGCDDVELVDSGPADSFIGQPHQRLPGAGELGVMVVPLDKYGGPVADTDDGN